MESNLIGATLTLMGISVTMLIALAGVVYKFGVASSKLSDLSAKGEENARNVQQALRDLPTIQSAITLLSGEVRDLGTKVSMFPKSLAEVREEVVSLRERQKSLVDKHESLADAFASRRRMEQQWRRPIGSGEGGGPGGSAA